MMRRVVPFEADFTGRVDVNSFVGAVTEYKVEFEDKALPYGR